MFRYLTRLFIPLFICLPTFASAADTLIHAAWNQYIPPSGYTVAGYNLYQEGTLACQVPNPAATTMDCAVTLTADTTYFTLTASFSDGTQSLHSQPFAYTINAEGNPDGSTTSPHSTAIHAEWTSYTAPSGYSVTGFNLYQEGVTACQVQDPNTTSIECTVTLTADTTAFTLTVSFSDGTESPHSAPFFFTLDSTTTPDEDPATDDDSSSSDDQDTGGSDDSSTGDTSSGSDDTSGPSDGSITTPHATTIHAEWTSYNAPSGYSVTGFNLYQEGENTCQAQDANAESMDCDVTLNQDTTAFTLTASFSNGTESPHSEPFFFSISDGTDDGTGDLPGPTLAAAFSTDPLSGQAPLPVNFDATASTGDIVTYQWKFGDGTTASGSTASHTYGIPGTYSAMLTISDDTGQISTSSATVTITEATAPPPATSPTAVISSSTAAGPAPLQISLDGSGSAAAGDATISSYAWSFGDGASATGAITGHTYTTAGTFNAELTVTDSNGISDTTATPIVVTASSTANTPPTAVASATPISGTVPLTVTFNGSASSDLDGTIASYAWDFGDGKTASGATVTHTYTSVASFVAVLTVTDDQGAQDSAIVNITGHSEEEAAPLNMELGEISVGSEWVRVTFEDTFTNPVVIAGPPSFNDAEPCVVRLRNVNSTGFDISLTEWDYLDGVHAQETVSYLVMEKGRHTLPDGSTVEAGVFTGTTSFRTATFTAPFATTPVVITTIASYNEARAISGRLRNIGIADFAYSFREQEDNNNIHADETVHFIAWEPGRGTIDSLQFEVATTGNEVTDAWHSATYQETFQHAPLLLADMQTTNDDDPAALRARQITTTGFQIKVEEEQSRDDETTHTEENIGYLAFAASESTPGTAIDPLLTTIHAQWTNYSAPSGYTLTGFNLYQEDTLVCRTQDPTATSLDCTVTLIAVTTHFTLTSSFSDGSESPHSEPFAFTVNN